ncbi:YfhJ family protein [Jeotgalibacillus sp. JSM ZJ347]|uniref:YfhJ family protein n=1 Tax=Jeotgalibacillus sp. JSM ZJ347 TaxID=3342117 RepID=UPI0035A96810
MSEEKQALIDKLRLKDPTLSEEKAGMLIDLLREDFEATYAKAGYEYQGEEMSKRIVEQWIDNYGDRINEVAAMNEKYAAILKNDDIH